MSQSLATGGSASSAFSDVLMSPDGVDGDVVGLAVDVGGLDIEADQLRLLRQPGFVVELDRIVADGDDEIGVLMRLADDVAQRVEQHARIAGMILGEHALGHRRQHDGDLVRLGELWMSACTPAWTAPSPTARTGFFACENSFAA